MKNKNILYIALATVFILLIPLVAMQLTNEVNWSGTDFIVAGVLLFGTGLIFNLAMKKFPRHRVTVGAVIVTAFLYIWAELAVGIFTNWGS